jgi:predicted dinucleotide-binding enzyme
MEGDEMKVGILGTGDVGRALGVGFAKQGHEVKMGSRDPNNPKLAEFVQQAGPRASGGTFAEAAAFGEVILLATLWSGTENALKLAGAKAAVTGICTGFGWPTIDIGGIEGSRLLEPMCILWVLFGIRTGSWNHAFKLLTK